MHRDISQAAAVLGLKPMHLRKKLRELGVINEYNELANKHRGGPHFFIQTRQRWNNSINDYSYYGVIMVTEKGIGWIAGQLAIQIVKAAGERNAA